MTDVLADLAFYHGKPDWNATLKAEPSHFKVNEVLGFEPSGSGEHFFVRIRKIGENTRYVANELAKACGVKSRDVSWAGLKDRHATTEQWFSVHLPGKPDPDLTEFVASHEGVDAVVATTRHSTKLRPGDLRGNEFELVLSQLAEPVALETRLVAIREQGVPNYFGSQRFGREGNNLHSARNWGKGEFRVRDKAKRSFYLSAARSYLFNLIVSRRIQDGLFNLSLKGDLIFNDQGELDLCESDNVVSDSISAPMTGDNALPTKDKAQQYEQGVIDCEPNLLAVIRDNRMRHERRMMRLQPQNMCWQFENNAVRLSFALPAGSFATSVVRELVVLKVNGESHAHFDQ